MKQLLEISPAARQQIRQKLRDVDRTDLVLRIAIIGRSEQDFRYRLGFIPEPMRDPHDLRLQLDGMELLVDPLSARYLEGSRLDYQDGAGFQMENPNPLWWDPQADQIQQLIESKVNPAIALHGGHVTLLDVRDEVVYVSMGGGCQGCGLASVTLRQGVEKMIKQAVPSIESIVDTTDHAQGAHPYFRPEAAGESPLG